MDIWTSGDGRPYLGVKMQFYDANLMCPSQITLALKEFSHLHTGKRIANLWYSEWGLQAEQVGKIVTDNGSNTLKGFNKNLARYYAFDAASNMLDDKKRAAEEAIAAAEEGQFIADQQEADTNLDASFDEDESKNVSEEITTLCMKLEQIIAEFQSAEEGIY